MPVGWLRSGLPGPPGEVIGAVAVTASVLWALEIHRGGGPSGGLLYLARGRWRLIALPRSMRHSPVMSLVACGRDCALVGGAVRNSRGGTSPAVGRWNGRRWAVANLPARPGRDLDVVTGLVAAGRGLLATSAPAASSLVPGRLWQYWHGHWSRVHLAARHPAAVSDLTAIPGTSSAWATADFPGSYMFALISRIS